MSIRLSSFQVIKIQESINRYQEITNGYGCYRGRAFTPFKVAVEDLVEDILREILLEEIERRKYPMNLVKPDGSWELIR